MKTDKETKQYRKNQLLELNRGSKQFSVKFYDYDGNSTNYLNLSAEEMNKVSKLLAGKF